ncbi:MAG: FAD-binding oxidoreductase [Rhodospirillales bacterium]
MTRKVVIVGGGMAGISLAAVLSAEAEVVVLERESTPGYHATGRSAAVYAPAYGNRTIRALTAASRDFFENPPEGFAASPLLEPRHVMFFARQDQQETLARLLGETAGQQGLREVNTSAVLEQIPCFRSGYLHSAVEDVTTSDIDVDALLQGYARQLRRNGGRIVTDFDVKALNRQNSVWTITSTDGRALDADIVVNAAGAWADGLAVIAGAAPAGLTPLRRTAITIDSPAGVDVSAWSIAIDADEKLYFKPEAGRILVSPADETPSEPCDAQPEELDIAICVDRLQSATDLSVRHISHKWAGLRTFAPDRTPVVGYDKADNGFFWLAGQGGYGIQTAPAMAELAASLVLGKGVPERLAAFDVREEDLSPHRFTTASESRS